MCNRCRTMTKPCNTASQKSNNTCRCLVLITSLVYRHLALPRHIEVLHWRFLDRPLAAKQNCAHHLTSQAHMAEHATFLHMFRLVTSFPLLSWNPASLIFLSLFQIISLDFTFRLVQQSKPNTINALTLCLQSHPLICHSLPLKTECQTLIWITLPCGIVASNTHSLLFLFPYSQLSCSILVLSQHHWHINTHCLSRIGSSNHQGISVSPFLSLLCAIHSSHFPSSDQSVPKRRPQPSTPFYCAFHTLLSLSQYSQVVLQWSIPLGSCTINNHLSTTSSLLHHVPCPKCHTGSIVIYPSLSNLWVDKLSAIHHVRSLIFLLPLFYVMQSVGFYRFLVVWSVSVHSIWFHRGHLYLYPWPLLPQFQPWENCAWWCLQFKEPPLASSTSCLKSLAAVDIIVGSLISPSSIDQVIHAQQGIHWSIVGMCSLLGVILILPPSSWLR